jgi:hypothetical protein
MTTKVFNRPHIIVPEEDTKWALDQKPCVLKFWQQCWVADPYGSRWMRLTTDLSDSAFRLGRRILEATRLFLFRRISDGRTSFWEVRNLHGARVKDFWRGVKSEADTASNKADTASKKTITASNKAPILLKTQSEKAFENPSGTPQEHITNSSKEFVMCVSSTLARISQGEETAIAPLRGASPQIVEGMEEKEEDLPVATDCTTLTLVDAVQDEPTSLDGENQASRDEPKTPHEGTCSAAPAPSYEKWSSEAIVARSKARPMRTKKLKLAMVSKENPGFEYLKECWDDDPALQIIIKDLLGNFPSWGKVTEDTVGECNT